MHAKQDRRSRRTRGLVATAMMELMLEKPYDKITVQAILDRADIGRATFYTHFRDKADVVDSIAADMFDAVGQREFARSPAGAGLIPALELFRHAQERSQSLRLMVGSPNGEVFWATSQAALSRAVERALKTGRARSPVPGIPAAVLSHYLAAAFLGVLKWWLKSGMPYSPEEMTAMVQRLEPTATSSTGGR